MVWCWLKSFVALRALCNPSLTCCPPPTINQSLQIQNEADACLRVALAAGANPGYQFKTHPNIDKAAYGCVQLGVKLASSWARALKGANRLAAGVC